MNTDILPRSRSGAGRFAAESFAVPRRVIDRPGHSLVSGILPSRAGECIPTEEQHRLRGTCPKCGGPVVANMYDCGGIRGYLLRYECWAALMPDTANGLAVCNWCAIP